MASLRQIRTRITSVKNIRQITRAMKMVASARLRQAQNQLMEARPYALKMTEMICAVSSKSSASSHPLLAFNDVEREARVILTSDKGMCGGFNYQPLQQGCALTPEVALHDKQDYLCLGRKGLDFFRRNGIALYKQWAGFWQELNWYHADEIAEEIMKDYSRGKWSKVTLVYNKFKSAIVQETVTKQLLPLPKQDDCGGDKRFGEYNFEPDVDKIFDHLLPRYVKTAVWHALLESKAAEQAARMQAMENATQSAGDMIDDMTLQLNRARQAAITNEISELVGSAEAING